MAEEGVMQKIMLVVAQEAVSRDEVIQPLHR